MTKNEIIEKFIELNLQNGNLEKMYSEDWTKYTEIAQMISDRSFNIDGFDIYVNFYRLYPESNIETETNENSKNEFYKRCFRTLLYESFSKPIKAEDELWINVPITLEIHLTDKICDTIKRLKELSEDECIKEFHRFRDDIIVTRLKDYFKKYNYDIRPIDDYDGNLEKLMVFNIDFAYKRNITKDEVLLSSKEVLQKWLDSINK